MNDVTVRPVTLNDLAQLAKISRQTFVETFSAVNTAENMALYLEKELSDAGLTAELNNANAAFYFAEDNGEVIGYLKLNFGAAQTELQDDSAIEIERIYVVQAYHGKKIGQLLYEKAMAVAKEHNAHYIWLGVWEHNLKAIQFYTKNGFVAFDKHIFKLGDDEQTDLMMKLELR